MAGAQEHYSLRWNDHQNQILLAFDALLQTKSLVDVTLVCAETSIRAHKVVLSACSPFFQRVFAENPCKHPVIVLKDFSGWVVQAIVDFMYRGEISVPQERLQTLIQAGESLQVRGLIDHPVTGNTPTPAASPDDFNGLLSTRDGSFKGETTFLNHKLMFTPQIFMDGSGNQKSSIMDSLCTSPMPRRKQARPRRRSGDFSPPHMDNGEHSAGHGNEDEYDTENNKNFKNVDGEKESLSKSSSVLSLDTAAEEPEDLCTKPLDEQCGDELSGSAKRKRLSGQQQVQMDNENGDSEAPVKRASSESGASARRSSGNTKEKSASDSRIVLSLKDIRHFNNATSDSQRAHHLMASRFLNQSPNSILKTMSSHLGFNAGGGRLSPKSLNEAKFNAMHFRGPPMDLVSGSRHSKFYGNKMHEEDGDEQGNDEDEEYDEPQDKSMGDDHLDGDSGDENKQGSDDGRKSHAKESAKTGGRRERAAMEDNNNNNRLDMLMSMNGPNSLLMDHMEFKHRQHLFQQHQQQQQHNGLEALKSSHHMSHHNRTSSSASDLLAESRKNHNESTPVGSQQHHNHRGKDYSGTSPMSLPPPFNMSQGGDAHPPFPPMPSVSSLALTPPHMFGLDTPLGLFPPHGMDPSKLYSPLMEMSDPRGMHPEQQPYLKKKGKFLGRPKGQHSAPRGGPPRSWTNAELTEALQHVWNKKMTTSQASRIFGIPYNSLLMYVRGKYGKSLKLEQLRKDCISGPPIELLQMGANKGSSNPNGTGNGGNNKEHNNGNAHHSNKELKDFDLAMGGGGGGGGGDVHGDLLSSSNPMFNPFPANFYPDFAAGFPGLPLSMLNLLPPDGRQAASLAAAAAAAGHLPNMSMDDDDDCKSEDRSKQSLEDDEYQGVNSSQPLDLNRHENHHRQEMLMQHQD